MEDIENKYTSVFMFQDSSKQDILDFKKTYKYKMPFDIGLVISLVIIVLGIIILFFTPGAMFIILIGLLVLSWRYSKVKAKKEQDFLDKLECEYVKGQEKYSGAIACSAIYPTYYFYDNKIKRFKFMYQDKIYIDIPYDIIKSYEILNDKVVSQYNRLPNRPNPTVRSYILRIHTTDDKQIDIGYSNANKYLKLKGNFVYQQYANTITINKICALLERIIAKGRV